MVAKRICTDPVFVALPFCRVPENDRSSSCGFDDFVSYYFATGTVQIYSAERIAPLKCQRADDGLTVPFIEPAIDSNWPSGVAHKTILEVKRENRRYLVINDYDAGRLADVPAKVVDDLYDIFA